MTFLNIRKQFQNMSHQTRQIADTDSPRKVCVQEALPIIAIIFSGDMSRVDDDNMISNIGCKNETHHFLNKNNQTFESIIKKSPRSITIQVKCINYVCCR